MDERLSDLLRRLHLDLGGLANTLLKLFAAPRIERTFLVTIAAGETSVSAPHGLGRQLRHATVAPRSAVAYGVTWDASAITVELGAAEADDVVFAVAVS